MNLKITCDELNNVCISTDNNSEMLKKEIDFWMSELNKLQEIWSGDDASEFFKNSTNYIKKMEIIPNTFNKLSNFMKSANIEYNNVDNEAKLEFERNSQEDVMKEYV